MAKQKLTISEALGWLKTLKARQAELVALRNQNSTVQERSYSYGDRDREKTVITPQYDAKDLDKRITLLSREIRLCDMAIKRANATTALAEYLADDDVLGELQ